MYGGEHTGDPLMYIDGVSLYAGYHLMRPGFVDPLGLSSDLDDCCADCEDKFNSPALANTPEEFRKQGLENCKARCAEIYGRPHSNDNTLLYIIGSIAGIFIEPLDYLMTAAEIGDDPTNPLSYTGLLPFVPSAAGKGLKQLDKLGDAASSTSKIAKTPIDSGLSRATKKGKPNSIYEQVDDAGKVRSRTFYDENGHPFARQDFDHSHGGMRPHEHTQTFDANGRPITKEVTTELPPGYDNMPSE